MHPSPPQKMLPLFSFPHTLTYAPCHCDCHHRHWRKQGKMRRRWGTLTSSCLSGLQAGKKKAHFHSWKQAVITGAACHCCFLWPSHFHWSQEGHWRKRRVPATVLFEQRRSEQHLNGWMGDGLNSSLHGYHHPLQPTTQQLYGWANPGAVIKEKSLNFDLQRLVASKHFCNRAEYAINY